MIDALILVAFWRYLVIAVCVMGLLGVVAALVWTLRSS